jgi:hypothetical protein
MKKIFGLIVISIALLVSGCGEDDPAFIGFSQYADEVLGFSSEYNASPDSWSAFQLLGAPNVYPGYDDIEEAWTTEDTQLGRQYLVLGFDTIQTVSKIEIYETYNPGAIDTVYLRNASTQAWDKVYTGSATPTGVDEARIFTVTLSKPTTYFVDAIRLAIDSDMVDDWIEIDAIAISGKRKK